MRQQKSWRIDGKKKHDRNEVEKTGDFTIFVMLEALKRARQMHGRRRRGGLLPYSGNIKVELSETVLEMGKDSEKSSKKRKRSAEDDSAVKDSEECKTLNDSRPETKKITKAMKKIGESVGLTFSGQDKLEVEFESLWENFPKPKRIKKLPDAQKEKAMSRIFSICTRSSELSSKLLHRFGDKHCVGGVAGLGIDMPDELVVRVEKKADRILDNEELWKRTLGASRRCVHASLKHLSDALREEDQSDTADADAAWTEASQADVEANEEDKTEDERDENAALRAERGGKAESSTSGFMEWYMSKFTDSFAEELDSIRSKEELDANGVSLLVDAIKSGVDVIPKVERYLCMPSDRAKQDSSSSKSTKKIKKSK
ncbi:hypothetical protein GUITHDRAFT_132826 [Guillardia theta CCMP2712]|uniref:Ribosome-assembly protein 3 C-terminal domain-containing protein n=2 Tax=Guillardia theta TaxID=55529 RepID=L1JZL0_GUITC|nr:hypothetical protein GUITHDRAFT_132826 [Guillardia theta CCMP2712]EKX53772.1 hypothetical protein GUITHDRAFT_132826 [Guillardia theta CCMP2712]|eukprot:XP_005840752.1 hypothetical protein GUITHDRAFT_132826 [Guillardia theta CCMP2712]